MNIECPKCNTSNSLKNLGHIHCEKCKQCFTGFSFRKHKTTLSATALAMVAGGYIGVTADARYLEKNRYPTAAIYEIVSYCASPRNVVMTKREQEQLASECICALDKSMAEVRADEFKTKSSEFRRSFEKNIRVCRFMAG